MKKGQLQKILNDIRNCRIIVVGDFCLDAYWFIDETMSEISVETGQVTRPVSDQRYSLGGAGNVANNLAAMGIKEVLAFGVTGNDPFGTEMARLMRNTGINTNNLLIQEHEWNTHTYVKPYIKNSELNRVDFGNFNRLAEVTADCLIENLIGTVPNIDIIIINQQVSSGIHTDYFRQRLAKVILQFPKKIFITDSRKYNDYYNGTIRKMNDTEALRLCGHNRNPDELISLPDLVPSAKKLFKKYQKPLLITRGARGSIAIDDTGLTEIPGLMILSKVDTVGAGDSYLAGAAAALAAGHSLQEAALLGTFVAGVTVKKLYQTGTANPDEILTIGEDPDFILSPELAEDNRHACYFENTEIEIINSWKVKPEVKHAIFDHDGTISTLREGWELIMAPVMIRAILGDRYDDADDPLFKMISLRVQDYIDKTTGIQTLAQMHGLLDLIREFGCVPEEKILDPSGYKHSFNNELMNMVKERERKLKNEELCIDDLTIKKAVPFLQFLFDSGIKLWLASGTDVEDVMREARTLGYEHLFEGRIYGAVGDITREAKKNVLDHILDKIGNPNPGNIVTFGDGPVEIRETNKRGGLTVGIASNELRRFGLNEHKRTRLINAGADIIMPDFSQYHMILKLLNI